MLDLLVIGAGPHALSLVCRLIDDDPDLLTERERVRIMQKAGSRSRSHAAVRRHLKKKFDGSVRLPGVAVIDMHGHWMAQWERDFSALAIPHTRSHADLHPCPYDFQSLRVWAETQRRDAEMWHMQYIDREASRAQGYAGPYVLPGTQLFVDFCRSLVERYGLDPLVSRGSVEDLRVVPPAAEGGTCTVEARLADGTVLAARRVVCAMGPGPMFRGMRATLPWWADDLAASLAAAGPGHVTRMLHSSQLVPWLLGVGEHSGSEAADGGGAAALRGRRVLVVGGGQTAGHLALLALERGAANVALAARRQLTQKPYDVNLELVGDRRAEALAKYRTTALSPSLHLPATCPCPSSHARAPPPMSMPVPSSHARAPLPMPVPLFPCPCPSSHAELPTRHAQVLAS